MAESHATPTSVKVLHAGALTSLVGRGLGPAFERATDIPVVAERGHSVALADGIKVGSRVGGIYMSADASANERLRGAANGDWVRWFVAFARNAVVLAYSPRSSFAAGGCAAVRSGGHGGVPDTCVCSRGDGGRHSTAQHLY
jgi:ABC-type molybdate transport system substrate-binding protein